MTKREISQRVPKASISVWICEKFLKTDIFGEAFTMSISKGIHRLPSRIGVLLTLFVSMILIAFTFNKVQIMIEKNDDVMYSMTEDYYYDSEYVMDASKYFNFAIALTGFDNDRESVLDPSIAELYFMAYEWDIYENKDGNFDYTLIPIESHPCSKEELGLSGNKS